MATISLMDQLDQIIESDALKFVEKVEAELRANAPVYTGKLISTIKTTRLGKWKWWIGPDTDYDWYAEHGNHANAEDGKIHPVRANALAWIDNQGRKHVRSWVSPYEGSHFVEKTAKKYK